MKKLILSAITVTMLLMSCQKESLVKEIKDETNFSIRLIDINDGELSFKNNLLSENYAMCVESLNEETNTYTVRYFEDVDQLYIYSLNNAQYFETKKNIEAIRAIQEVVINNGDFLLENPSEENLSKETIDILNNYGYNSAGKTNGIAILFDNSNQTGQSFGIHGTPLPTFGSFRNKASSGISFGLGNFACTKLWWKGRWISFLVSGPFNLQLINFNNDLESGF